MARIESSTKRLKRKVRNSYIISTVSIALVLFLLGSVGYMTITALKATKQLKENITLNVMLKNNTTSAAKEALAGKLTALENVNNVRFVSKTEAAAEFKNYIGSDFENFLSYNPLPDAYEVTLKSTADSKAIRLLDKEISEWKEVDEVVYQKGVLEQVSSNINKLNLILVLFGFALLVISTILLNNTIRISIYSKRYMINTMKLVGASKWFILKPFLGNSILQGLYAWLIAGLMFVGLLVGLNEGLPEIGVMANNTPAIITLGAMLGLGVLISVLFTIFAVNKFINMNSSKIYLY